ncbi:MAG TPA: FAD-dependent oxidoreductase [Mycobacteriales bacterium]|nr:FAD-dependent oxidoreductase [Mycobacteriales bacterium]
MSHLVVVGGSLAGLRAIGAARKAGFSGELTLIGAEPHLPYDRPPLSKVFLDTLDLGVAPLSTTFHDEAHLRDELGVSLRLGTPVSGLDLDAREVQLADRAIRYDHLVIATGADARRLPGSHGLAGVHTLRSVDDARAIRGALDAGARTVVIGAGFIGSEVAASARKRGLDVTIIEALPVPLSRAVGDELGPMVARLHGRNGTTLICGVTVEALVGSTRVEGVALSDGRVLAADLVVVGIGAVPTTGWLEGSGLALNDGVVCDATLSTGHPGVYAAGDVARWHNPLFDRSQRLEHWTSAAEQGAAAGRNAISPAQAKPYSTVPYFWSDWYDARIQFVGIPDADEVRIVEGDPERDPRWVGLYRSGDRITGALAVNGQSVIMKYRAMIGRQTSFREAIEFGQRRQLSPT